MFHGIFFRIYPFQTRHAATASSFFVSFFVSVSCPPTGGDDSSDSSDDDNTPAGDFTCDGVEKGEYCCSVSLFLARMTLSALCCGSDEGMNVTSPSLTSQSSLLNLFHLLCVHFVYIIPPGRMWRMRRFWLLQTRRWADGGRLLHQRHPGFRARVFRNACRTVFLRLNSPGLHLSTSRGTLIRAVVHATNSNQRSEPFSSPALLL